MIGQSSLTSSTWSCSASGMKGPWGLLSTDGNLFVCDRPNNRVLLFNSIPTASGAKADVVIGQPNMTTGSSGSGAAGLNTTKSVSSYLGKLYVADTGNNRILIFNSIPSSNGASADQVFGQSDFTGVGANGSAAEFVFLAPSSISATENGLCVV